LVNDGGSVLADFSFTLNGTMVQFDNQSTGATNYVWNFGDGNGSVFSDPSHLYEEDSSYVVMLIAINGACADTAYATINTGSASIFIPNVFSPNNDGNNDVFGFSASGIETFHCMIYNRWGQLMAELSTPDAFWDGRDANGTEVPEGVYFFMLEATSSLLIYVATHTDLPAGKSLHAEGTVTLIRGK
jgi:gliding motility-associated-like protein